MNFEKYFWRYIMVALLIIFVAFFIKWTECICKFTSSSIHFINNANEGVKNMEHFDLGSLGDKIKKTTTDTGNLASNAVTKAKSEADAAQKKAATLQQQASDAKATALQKANTVKEKAKQEEDSAKEKAQQEASVAKQQAQQQASALKAKSQQQAKAAKAKAQQQANTLQQQADTLQQQANAAKAKAQQQINNITSEENLFMESFNAEAHEAANEEARIRVENELAHHKREDAVKNLIKIQREYNDAKMNGKPQHILNKINQNLQKAKYEHENVNQHMNLTNKRLKNAEFNSIKFNNDGNILNIPNAMESFNTGETKLSTSLNSSLHLAPPDHPIQLNKLSSLDQDPQNRRFDNEMGIESFECNIDSPNNVIAKYMNNINRVTDKVCNTSEYKLVQDKMTGGNNYLDSKKQNEYVEANNWIH